MTLPDGWELGPDGMPRPKKRKTYRLSDLVIDEVSVVKRGANRRAHIVLFKSEDGQQPEESTMPTDPYGPAAMRYADAADVAKHYAANPGEYDQRHAPKIDQRPSAAGIGKGDADVSEEELEDILGLHQRVMAARREAALADASRSLFQLLMSPEFAASYDALYGRAK